MNREELVKQLDLLKLILSGEAGKKKLEKERRVVVKKGSNKE